MKLVASALLALIALATIAFFKTRSIAPADGLATSKHQVSLDAPDAPAQNQDAPSEPDADSVAPMAEEEVPLKTLSEALTALEASMRKDPKPMNEERAELERVLRTARSYESLTLAQ